MNFVAIDFETANRDRASACSVGLVRVAGGVIQDSAGWLIKPPQGTYFLRDFIAIHGITPSMVQNEPEFPALWPQMKRFIGNDLLVAHNAAFDMNVLRGLLERYSLVTPELYYLCSLATARRAWTFPSNKLNDLARELGLVLNHHHADSDAKVCAEIMLKALAAQGCADLAALIEKLRLRVCALRTEAVDKTSWTKTDFRSSAGKQAVLQARNQTAAAMPYKTKYK